MNEFNQSSVVSDLTAALRDITDEQLKSELARRSRARRQAKTPAVKPPTTPTTTTTAHHEQPTAQTPPTISPVHEIDPRAQSDLPKFTHADGSGGKITETKPPVVVEEEPPHTPPPLPVPVPVPVPVPAPAPTPKPLPVPPPVPQVDATINIDGGIKYKGVKFGFTIEMLRSGFPDVERNDAIATGDIMFDVLRNQRLEPASKQIPALREEAYRKLFGAAGADNCFIGFRWMGKSGAGVYRDNDLQFAYEQIYKPVLQKYGIKNHLSFKISFIEQPFLVDIKRRSYPEFLAACARYVGDLSEKWFDLSAEVPDKIHLFNEPTAELPGYQPFEIVDIIRACGNELRRRRNGLFAGVKFVVNSEYIIEAAIPIARAIADNAGSRDTPPVPAAKDFCCAMATHLYSVDGGYRSLPTISQQSGRGFPSLNALSLFTEFRAICELANLPVYVSEQSNSSGNGDYNNYDSNFAPFTMNNLRMQAVAAHDYLRYLNVEQINGMMAFWSQKAHFQHTGGGRIFEGEAEAGVLIYDENLDSVDPVLVEQAVKLTGFSQMMRHFTKAAQKTGVRVASNSTDRLILSTAFVDSAGNLGVVLINNAPVPKTVYVNYKRAAGQSFLPPEMKILTSKGDSVRCAEAFTAIENPDGFTITLPPESVVSVY